MIIITITMMIMIIIRRSERACAHLGARKARSLAASQSRTFFRTWCPALRARRTATRFTEGDSSWTAPCKQKAEKGLRLGGTRKLPRRFLIVFKILRATETGWRHGEHHSRELRKELPETSPPTLGLAKSPRPTP